MGILFRGLKAHYMFGAIGWFVIGFGWLVLWNFVRAKTKERTLLISQGGIYTEIGKARDATPWKDVREVIAAKAYILIVNKLGSAFFIPSRAFATSIQRAEFLSEIARFRL
jgi:hypothetical protein